MVVDKPGDGRCIGRQADKWRLALPRRDVRHCQCLRSSGCAHQASLLPQRQRVEACAIFLCRCEERICSAQSFADEFLEFGGTAISQFGKRLLVRAGDAIGRLGGGEFGVLRDVCQEQAMIIAQNIRRHIEAIPWVQRRHDDVKVTVSIGGAEIARHADAQDVLRAAGRCLFEAKRRGRNRVSFECEIPRSLNVEDPRTGRG
ncbi:MAG: GGDEF domain-containing protein [Mesorhizobium sp.]|nr:MAG: GGDEF domain-containing protein [Mesorhizobium sp.]